MVFAARPQKIKLNHIQNSFLMEKQKNQPFCQNKAKKQQPKISGQFATLAERIQSCGSLQS